MKIDQRELDDAAEAQNDSLTEGLTGTIKSVLNNPVLPFGADRSSALRYLLHPEILLIERLIEL